MKARNLRRRDNSIKSVNIIYDMEILLINMLIGSVGDWQGGRDGDVFSTHQEAVH